MPPAFVLTSQSTADLDEIWHFIASDSPAAADLVEAELLATFRMLALHPHAGHARRDITPLPVRFWTLTKYRKYVVVYRPDTRPLQIVAILHGKRDVHRILNDPDITGR
jgi:plasmid stabilization system protein ParE